MNVNVISIIITLIAFLLSISFHESFHALSAYMLGDDTAKKAGRITLNPFKHIDPIGLLFIFLIGIGWAKPVPIDPNHFSRPRLYSFIVGLAGPFSNFILACISAFVLKYISGTHIIANAFFREMLSINVILGLFNLIPIPPLDGSQIIQLLIPKKWLNNYYKWQFLMIIVLIVIFNIPSIQIIFFNVVQTVTKVIQKLV